MRRVVLTGAGAITPLGPDLASTQAALARGRTAIGPLDLPLGQRLAVRLGAAVAGFRGEDHFSPARLGQLDRFAQLAVVAGRQALADSALPPAGAWRAQAGALIGNSGGGLQTQEAAYHAVFAQGRDRVAPLTVPRLMGNAAPAALAADLGLWGPSFALSSACASSHHALAVAAAMIRAGAGPVMLAGGAEAMLTFTGLKAWEALRVLSPSGCRPFAADRDGMVMGEGAAVFVLEERDHALARGAPIRAEVLGQAMGAEAGDLVQPQVQGAARLMQAALADAGLAPRDIGLVKAHGTGTVANDRAEAQALAQVFGPAPPPVIAPKALFGHAIGAAGALELTACLLALQQDLLAPAPDPADPALGIDLVQGAARRQRVRAVLANAFAFGGLGAALVLGRHDA